MGVNVGAEADLWGWKARVRPASDAAYILEETLGNTLVLSAEFSLGGLLGEEEPLGVRVTRSWDSLGQVSLQAG